MTKEQESIEILNKFKNSEMQRDKLERGRDGGWKIGDIYKLLELNPAIETVLSMIEKKDKQIDLMAEHIAFNQKVNSYEDIKTYKEQIKQHYENQSKLFKYNYNKKSTLDINSNAKI